MIILNYDLLAGTAKTSQSTTIKAGGGVPVQVVFSETPGAIGGLQLTLGSTAEPPAVLAFLDVDGFSRDNDTTWSGVLDASDSRLVSYLAGKTETVSAELIAVIDGVTQVTPNFTVTVQPKITPGSPASEGGPSYYTAAQVTAAIATAISTAVAGLASKTVTGKYRIKDDGTVELWNASQGQWQPLTLTGAAGAEILTIGGGES